MDWLAHKHALLTHLPVATGLLLPWALLAAQRPGRGIRPWWTVARYLGWMGLAGMLGAFLTGYPSLVRRGYLPAQRLLPSLSPATGGPATWHLLLALGSLVLAGAAVWAMNRPRREHQSLGKLALALGLLWCAVLLMAGHTGDELARGARPAAPAPLPAPVPAKAVAPAPAAPAPPPAAGQQPTARILDYTALEPLHPDPVKSLAHGGRWVRAWVTPGAAAAYRAGQALPAGAVVVLSSVEERWGRPGPDPGPLCALESTPDGPVLTYYWGRVPPSQRKETGGEAQAYWRGADARLESCRACHAQGMADPARRSRWRPARR